MSSRQTTKSDAARIQSTQAKAGGDMTSGGFAARAQAAADRNANAAGSGNSRGGSSTGGSGGSKQGSSGGSKSGSVSGGGQSGKK
ncbi:hypothetical protein GP486_005346 [Trichoglossum hirsutum]|uniref:SMP domain-containing protein n=1 Tax=Trichoglossum hirsutum TaxID=265104 RepID=A0A9P8RME3_9PEZI|nr:hypothetical protein GP486_005346 [Trichoglossum hirsutum]